MRNLRLRRGLRQKVATEFNQAGWPGQTAGGSQNQPKPDSRSWDIIVIFGRDGDIVIVFLKVKVLAIDRTRVVDGPRYFV